MKMNRMGVNLSAFDFQQLASHIKCWGQELGFQQIAITDIDLSIAEQHLQEWLAKGYHGDMAYMARYGTKRSRPNELLPGTIRVISARIDYLPPNANISKTLKDRTKAFISRYALGRDYHKLIRKRLATLAKRIEASVGSFGYRVFADSAPVMEKPLAEKAGLGWMGKSTNIINSKAGSWFFLGTIYTDLPLPIDPPATNHCGSCRACIDVCPTQAIVAPYQLDAQRCISYLTIELKTSIPEPLRPLIGNRIYGCDDCQLVCPWNKFARTAKEMAFHTRHGLDDISLARAFAWTEQEFLHYTEGTAIRRIGYERWLRNIAVALGNSACQQQAIDVLRQRVYHSSELVREHVLWALKRLSM